MREAPQALLALALALGVAALLTVELGPAAETATGPSEERSRLELPQGVAVAEATTGGAVVWARCPDGDSLRVAVDGTAEREAPIEPSRDATARIDVSGLGTGSEHAYRARCVRGSESSEVVTGRFRTAPAPDQDVAVRFAFGGDVGGQNVCRDADRGYPVFAAVAAMRPDFFIALGDMIYADNRCLEKGRFGNRQVAGPPPALEKAGFWAHWRYNRSDRAHRELLSQVAYYPVWDDHEVVNDFGPLEDTPSETAGAASTPHLMRAGLDAFLDYNPIRSDGADETRLHRSFRWGRHLELFVLDARQHRDRNASSDRQAEPKTLLGSAQRDWLVRSLVASDATWKVVVSSVPLSIPTGTEARDGWADGGGPQGFERELRRILEQLRENRVRGIVFLTTDVHFATGFRYRPFPDDPEFDLHEIVTGPMHAGLVPLQHFDSTFAPTRLFSFAPAPSETPGTIGEALSWFNFGLVEVSERGELRARVIDATGKDRATIDLPPPNRPSEPAIRPIASLR
jgi:alkaline phosphatase D